MLTESSNEQKRKRMGQVFASPEKAALGWTLCACEDAHRARSGGHGPGLRGLTWPTSPGIEPPFWVSRIGAFAEIAGPVSSAPPQTRSPGTLAAQASAGASVSSGGQAERHNQRAPAWRPGEMKGHTQKVGSRRGPVHQGSPWVTPEGWVRTDGGTDAGGHMSSWWGQLASPRGSRARGFGWAYLTLPPAEDKRGLLPPTIRYDRPPWTSRMRRPVGRRPKTPQPIAEVEGRAMGAASSSRWRLIPPAAFQVWDRRGGGRRARKWDFVTRKGNLFLAVVLIFSSCCCFCGPGNRRRRMVCEKCELRGCIGSFAFCLFSFRPQFSGSSLSSYPFWPFLSIPNNRIVVLRSEWSQFCTCLRISFAFPANPGSHPIQVLTGSFALQTLRFGMDLKSPRVARFSRHFKRGMLFFLVSRSMSQARFETCLCLLSLLLKVPLTDF